MNESDPASNPAPRVIVAEDEAIIRLDLVETLREEGYDVVGETGRGDETLQLIAELEPDLAVLDVRMPGLDGIEVAREIVANRSAAVLILTAYGQRELVERAAEAGAMAYLVKPWQRNDLVPAIEMALARHRELLALARRTSRSPSSWRFENCSIARKGNSWTTSVWPNRTRFGSCKRVPWVLGARCVTLPKRCSPANSRPTRRCVPQVGRVWLWPSLSY